MREKRELYFDTEYYDHLYLKIHFIIKCGKIEQQNTPFAI